MNTLVVAAVGLAWVLTTLALVGEVRRRRALEFFISRVLLRRNLHRCALLLTVTVLGVFCWSLLFGLRREEPSHEALSDLLIDELHSRHPTLLPMPEDHHTDPSFLTADRTAYNPQLEP